MTTPHEPGSRQPGFGPPHDGMHELHGTTRLSPTAAGDKPAVEDERTLGGRWTGTLRPCTPCRTCHRARRNLDDGTGESGVRCTSATVVLRWLRLGDGRGSLGRPTWPWGWRRSMVSLTRRRAPSVAPCRPCSGNDRHRLGVAPATSCKSEGMPDAPTAGGDGPVLSDSGKSAGNDSVRTGQLSDPRAAGAAPGVFLVIQLNTQDFDKPLKFYIKQANFFAK